MQLPVLSGIFSDSASDFRTSYPRNLVPVPKNTGISEGYLRPADGIVQLSTGNPGIDRGGINWNGACYRVMGTKLVRVDAAGATTTLGDVGGSGQVTFDYSFDRLAIASSGKLYLWNGTTLQQVTDTDLGTVVDMLWIDGYFMTTDGTSLVVTDLDNPFAVNPLKYGSSEIDPDPVKALLKVRNEVNALNRYTIEIFDNIGGDFFPFQRIEGAQIMRGTVGTFTCAVLTENIVFMGGGRNESIAIWMAANGGTSKLSTKEIDQILAGYSESTLSQALLETRVSDGHQWLYIHLPDQTLVYDAYATQLLGSPVWFTLTTSIIGNSQYRARNFVYCYDRWIVGDPQTTSLGYFSDEVSSHWGQVNGWDFGTTIAYNGSRGAVFHELELICLTGRAKVGDDPTVWAQYSLDGMVWSQERSVKAGKTGERNKRLLWLRQGFMRNWRIQRFRGTSDAHLSIARLEAQISPLGA